MADAECSPYVYVCMALHVRCTAATTHKREGGLEGVRGGPANVHVGGSGEQGTRPQEGAHPTPEGGAHV